MNEHAALKRADVLASKVHDAIYAEPFDRKAASDAVWEIHNLIRPLLGENAPSSVNSPQHTQFCQEIDHTNCMEPRGCCGCVCHDIWHSANNYSGSPTVTPTEKPDAR